ncbi:helix-turn-helix domain-containing protein [Streptomyces decoyicus]|uniref:helix-turn-helix domain-containing protein n=1 Tax=Streptomyces decoyicus TaxID=249567 RepID=UPI00069E819F|nr:XRE family transcriptional regulator [Streptomyces decoyicus]QZY17716.1 XRE family transcriptional regulator [Streptomyces decoyicus]
MSGPGSGLRDGVENSRLAERLRELRRRTGLTLAALAERTPYSKSSWERYLNAKKLPPRGAVEALCRLAGEPPGQLVALWELADAAWSGRGRSGGARSGTRSGVRSGAGDPSGGTERGRGVAQRRSVAPGEGAVGVAAGARREVPGPRASVVEESVAPAGGGDRATPARPPQPAPQQQPPSQASQPPPQPSPPTQPSRRVAAAGAGACAGVVAVVAALVFGAAEGAVGSGPVDGAAPRPSEVTGCRATACDGKDPESMYCELPGAARTPWERTAARGQRVQIRYGTACGAVWGRLRDGRVGDRLEVSVPGAEPRSVRVVDRFDAEGDLVTPMAAARGPEGIRLCLYPAGGAAEECFSQ